MDCRTFRTHHVSYVDGALSAALRAELTDHLASCRSCAAHDTRIRRALMVARSLPRITPSANFSRRLEERLREARTSSLHAGVGAVAQKGSGFVDLLVAAGSVLAAGLLATVAVERFRSHELPVLPPVVAAAPESPALPLTGSAFVASASPVVAVWPAALLLDQAPLHFVTTELAEPPSR
jgi:anti-sigma factor RsiW